MFLAFVYSSQNYIFATLIRKNFQLTAQKEKAIIVCILVRIKTYPKVKDKKIILSIIWQSNNSVAN